MTHVTIAPHVLVRNIHQSAWKMNSANFALTEFSEVRSRLRLVAPCLWWKGILHFS
jgi:hypothetical protein